MLPTKGGKTSGVRAEASYVQGSLCGPRPSAIHTCIRDQHMHTSSTCPHAHFVPWALLHGLASAHTVPPTPAAGQQQPRQSRGMYEDERGQGCGQGECSAYAAPGGSAVRWRECGTAQHLGQPAEPSAVSIRRALWQQSAAPAAEHARALGELDLTVRPQTCVIVLGESSPALGFANIVRGSMKEIDPKP